MQLSPPYHKGKEVTRGNDGNSKYNQNFSLLDLNLPPD